METTNLISIQHFCTHYKVPLKFINSLNEYELIEIIDIKKETYFKITQLNEVEKMMRLHYDLDINFEGIDAIYNLLKQVEALQNEIVLLKNRLNFYETFM
jgi:hypothetical protein